MAGRNFKHYNVTFVRDVVQVQTVNVAVEESLSYDLGEQIARQLAAGRVKDSRWAQGKTGVAELTAVELAPVEAE